MGLDITIYRHRKDKDNDTRTFRDNVGYFRKVNFLVAWVCTKNRMELDDDDNCRDIAIGDADDLTELSMACREVLADHSKAEEKLPTMDGFFFGSTEYDDWYFNDVEAVADWADSMVKEAEPHDFFFLNAWW